MARAVEDAHYQVLQNTKEVPLVEVDYIFLSDLENTSFVPILVAVSKTTDRRRHLPKVRVTYGQFICLLNSSVSVA